MSGGIEGAADAITGGVLARAVEPDAGEGAASDARACLNCGETLLGKHCHGCGQSAHVHRTIGAFVHDLTHSIFHFEGKFWRTLPLLVFKPGQLTRRYIHGERARFVSPLAAFLFSVFLLFAAINWLGGPFSAGDADMKVQKNAASEFTSDIGKGLAEAKAKLADMEKSGATPAQIAEQRDEVTQLERATAFADGIDAEDFKAGPGDFNLKIGNPDVEAKLRHAFSDPQLLFYKLQSSAYKFSWALIPISIPFVWLLFAWRREFHGYDHAVFVTYSLTFMSLFLVLLAILKHLGPLANLRDPLLGVVPPLHLFAQVKGAYALRPFSALWRTVALLFIALFVLIAFGGMLLTMGVAGH